MLFFRFGLGFCLFLGWWGLGGLLLRAGWGLVVLFGVFWGRRGAGWCVCRARNGVVVTRSGGWVPENLVGVVKFFEEFVCRFPLSLLGFLVKTIGMNLFNFMNIGLTDLLGRGATFDAKEFVQVFFLHNQDAKAVVRPQGRTVLPDFAGDESEGGR